MLPYILFKYLAICFIVLYHTPQCIKFSYVMTQHTILHYNMMNITLYSMVSKLYCIMTIRFYGIMYDTILYYLVFYHGR